MVYKGIMNVTEHEHKLFISALKWLISPEGGGNGTLKGIASKYGCGIQYISQLLNGAKKAGYKAQLKFAEKHNMSRDNLLRVGEERLRGKDPVIHQNIFEPYHQRRKTDIELQTDKNHQELVSRFENKEIALRIKQLLVRIEQLEKDEGLKAALEWAEYRVHQAEKKRGMINPANGTERKS